MFNTKFKLGVFDSWEIISEDVALKTTDKSVFKHLGSGIPKGIREFWGVHDIKSNEKRPFKIIYKSKEYRAYIVMEGEPLKRTRVFWRSDLKAVLHDEFPDYESYFNDPGYIKPPIMRFFRIDDETYKVDFIIQDNIEADIVSEETEEIDFTPGKEGRELYHYSKKYERDPNNRLATIEIHGTRCCVCGFDFEEFYGERGRGFIEIHHTKPLFTVNAEVEVDPKTDLVPVCSNCHRMIHRRKDDVLSVSEARAIVEGSRPI